MTTQISNYLPYLYTNYEINYSTTYGRQYAKDNSQIPYMIICIYLTAIVCGKQYMKNRSPYHMKSHLALWNGSLCMFSFAGALRTTPELLYRLNTYSFTDNICNDTTTTWGTGACGFWVQLFIFSKIPELFDTYFIIARKKPLLFLHWYHHVTVLLYCWQSYASEAPQALPFVTVNYLVHTMMYGYYCLTTLNIKPQMLSPIYITAAQIIQMILGSYIQLVSSYNYYTNPTCHVKKDNIIFGGIMYLSYLGLFSQFAIKRYYQKRIKKL